MNPFMKIARIVSLLLAVGAALLFGRFAHAQGASADVTGVSRAFNPAISVNGLFLGNAMLGGDDGHDHDDHGDHGDEDDAHAEEEDSHGHDHGVEIADGWGVQALEVQLTSFVDPYVKANVMLGMHGFSGFEAEEAYLLTLGMPANLGLKAGKFLASFGRHNTLHEHAFPFVEAPMVNTRLFGEEGLNETGAELSWLAPVNWYSELTGAVYNGDNHVLFGSEESFSLAYLGRFKNQMDINDSTTLELGASGVFGSGPAGVDDHGHEVEGELSSVIGVDARVKWKPLDGRKQMLAVEGEFLIGSDDDVDITGGFGLAQYQFTRSWLAEVGFDWMTAPDDHGHDATSTRLRAVLAFIPTEFQMLRAQFASSSHPEEDAENSVSLQYTFTIGSHPAHSY